ncbi:putative oxidoreductase protein [Neofusicoccum parvum UCRNP2]|uniref:Putative oxidoreductase protein n=1 Tax=Botryosphaeria parva (strain UCR-NP2) TaxID=1287680 RepID=R1EI23_BOTPV|nr:putative oxidoreductase protein [Neofusicoccum parvum UCRNP2]
MAVSIAMPWTDGERTMQDLLRVPPDDNPTSSFLTPQAAAMLTRAPLLALGAVDADGRPWATVWGGNCPKYLNSRKITPATAQPELISDSPILSSEARAVIAKADLFFISSTNSTHDMDVNHRGGPTGFVRILPSDSPSSPTTLVYPEYSGNRYYSTVGNMHTTPLAGLCIPDFTTGTVLYATGTTTIQVGAAASALLPRSNLTISITLTSARLVRHGLSFRGSPAPGVGSAAAELVSPTTIGMSPYNPPVRLLAAEGNLLSSVTAAVPSLTATLTRKTLLTPDVARLTFTLSTPTAVQPGQWVALDASGELSIGYSHMRNDDPTSLNDDFIRTFTVTGASAWGSSAPTPLPPSAAFDVTVRRHGPVTALLLAASDRAGLELAVRGFGGEFRVPLEEDENEDAVVPFVAGGVGITPLLAELAHGLDAARVALFWTLRAGDAALTQKF